MPSPNAELGLLFRALQIRQVLRTAGSALGFGIGIRPQRDKLELFITISHPAVEPFDLPRFEIVTTENRLEADLERFIFEKSPKIAKLLRKEWPQIRVTEIDVHGLLCELGREAVNTFRTEKARLERLKKYGQFDLDDFFSKPLAFVEVPFEARKPRPGWVPSTIAPIFSVLAFLLLYIALFILNARAVRRSLPIPQCPPPLPPPRRSPIKNIAPPVLA